MGTLETCESALYDLVYFLLHHAGFHLIVLKVTIGISWLTSVSSGMTSKWSHFCGTLPQNCVMLATPAFKGKLDYPIVDVFINYLCHAPVVYFILRIHVALNL